MTNAQTDPNVTHARTAATDHLRTDRLRDAATQARDGVQDAAAQARDGVQDAADTVRHTAANAVERGSEQAHAVQSEFDSMVRRNPTLAVLGALGLGVALGLSMNKRA